MLHRDILTLAGVIGFIMALSACPDFGNHYQGWDPETNTIPDPSDDDSRRRYYAITSPGREALAREARRMELMIHAVRAKALLDSGEER